MRLGPINSFDELDQRGSTVSNVRVGDVLELQVLAAFRCACASSDLEVAEGLLSVLEVIDRRQNEAGGMVNDSTL